MTDHFDWNIAWAVLIGLLIFVWAVARQHRPRGDE